MLNITTEYPILKGDADVRIASLQGTLCNLIDELKYLLPQCSHQIDTITETLNGLVSGNNSVNE